MKAPDVPDHGPKKWREFAEQVLDYIMTIRPVAGQGITVSEIKGGGTLISSDETSGGLVVTLCQNGELHRFSFNGRDLGAIEAVPSA